MIGFNKNINETIIRIIISVVMLHYIGTLLAGAESTTPDYVMWIAGLMFIIWAATPAYDEFNYLYESAMEEEYGEPVKLSQYLKDKWDFFLGRNKDDNSN